MEGRFIAFEGIDGCGKGTQMELLRRRMTEEALPFVMTREPSDSPIGALLHQIMIGRIRTTGWITWKIRSTASCRPLTRGCT